MSDTPESRSAPHAGAPAVLQAEKTTGEDVSSKTDPARETRLETAGDKVRRPPLSTLGASGIPGNAGLAQNGTVQAPNSAGSNQNGLNLLSPPTIGTPGSMGLQGILSTPVGEQTGPSVINKQLLSKLNKSLKEKQKIISGKDHPKTAQIQDILTTSPVLSTFPSLVSTPANEPRPTSPSLDDEHEQETSAGSAAKEEPKKKGKHAAKQNSTRADFFAAKLASAVDDVSSSNSDETFVYENNVNDFDDNLASLSGPASGIPGSAALGTAEDHPESGPVPPSAILTVDNILTAGSLRNTTPYESTVNSPTVDVRREDDRSEVKSEVKSEMKSELRPDRDLAAGAESIHLMQSSKWNLRNTFSANTTPPTTNGRGQPHETQFLNPYFENIMRDASNKAAKHKSSSNSLASEEKSYFLRSPVLHYLNPNLSLVPTGTFLDLAAGGFHGSNYSFGEEEGEVDLCGELDMTSSQVSADSQMHTTITGPEEKVDVLSPKPKKGKTSTSSSKLRSTASKLFDKKGAQPRRYSTIPDDIDIEDFDDELIYYDNNNIRFPYNSQNGNESVSLLGSHRLPHYRSLNLNSGKRATSKGKRYTSLGYVPVTQNGKNADIFPFPYPEPNQKYYYDFDEYDEEAQDGPEELQAKGLGRNRLSPHNTRFMLPRKVSGDNFGGNKVRFVRSFVYTLISIIFILAVGFVAGFVLASTKDLTNISVVSIENALVSEDELVFSIVVEALNPGWFTVSIEDVEIDIFAKSGYLNTPSSMGVETVLLGSVSNFESAMVFEGSFFSRELLQQTGEIKLVAPGKNLTGSNDPKERAVGSRLNVALEKHEPDNSEKWAVISKHPFDLILRGVLKYNLPLTSTVKTALVNKVGYVDPSIPG